MAASDAELDAARAALAPTLEATASILPWVAKPPEPRFPPEPAGRWQATSVRLAAAWADRPGPGLADLRPAIFALCSIAIELADSDCLRLSEALASATDRLETPGSLDDARLVTSLSAVIECLAEPGNLEHEAFSERARHFTARLQRCAAPQAGPLVRSNALERIFLIEAGECLEQMNDALDALPPDAYGLKTAAARLARQAGMLELEDIVTTAGELVRLLTLRAGESVDLEAAAVRDRARSLVDQLDGAIAAIG